MGSYHRLAVAALLFSLPLGGRQAGAEAPGYVILPPSTALAGPHAAQQLLVETTAAGRLVGEAPNPTFASENPGVATVDDAGVVRPVADGETTITATVDGASVSTLVRVVAMQDPAGRSFRNDVQPVLARMGCNMGACHGALAGKGGFKLSLRGYDAEADFASITRAARGRRIEPTEPGLSLLLTKPTMAVPHKGGLRFKPDSPAYRIIAQWIAEGAAPPQESDARVESLEVFPAEATLRPGDLQRIIVQAKYSDGRVVDVTPWAKFAATNEAVAGVDDDGVINVTGHGGGAVTVWYASKVINVRITSPYESDAADAQFAEAPRRNFIDELVLEQLKLLKLPPAARCDDATFLRRAHLDTIGRLPTADEVRAFLADKSPDKRDRLIDQLLEREEFVDYWTYQWSDLLLLNGTKLRPAAINAFYQWIRERVQQNTPWDEFARQIVTAEGSSLENGATNFYAIHQDPEGMTENLSQAFLGLSIGCAKCHNHPLEKWTNDQYFAMANLMARVRAKGWGGDGRGGDGVRTLYVASRGDLLQPSTGRPQPPTPLDGEPLDLADTDDRREHLANWLTSPENPYFARAIANRIWANYFGVGLVEPIDDMRLSNPASSEALLDALAQRLVENKYDLKTLMRDILQSETYQRSAEAPEASADDLRHYASFYPRRLMAEVALDAISQVAGVPSSFTQIEFQGADFEKTDAYPAGTRALQLHDSAVVAPFLKTFGRHQRMITCQCERSNEPSLVQTLHVSNGDTILQKLASKEGMVERQLASGAPNYRIIEDVYLSALSRYPTDGEMTQLLASIEEAGPEDRRAAIEDVYWAVLSSREFLFNH